MGENDTAIYVIGGRNGPFKIGLAVNPARRLRALQTGSSGSIALLHARSIDAAIASDVERRAHWLLREHHTHGEWFAVGLNAAREAVDSAVENKGAGEKARPAVGRPPLKRDMKVEKTTLWLYRPVVNRIIELVGKQGLSEFMRIAAEAELKRRERAAAKERGDGSGPV